jgi:hypothetical protein
MDVLNDRQSNLRGRALRKGADCAWITRVLERVGKPPMLPPPGEP